MKKKKLNGKLSLNKQTISKLTKDKMNGIAGGYVLSGGARLCITLTEAYCGPNGICD